MYLQEWWQCKDGKSYSNEHLMEKGLLSKGGLGGCEDLLWDPAASHLGRVVFRV